MVRPAPAIDAIPATTPFVGPEQLMRERGLRELVRLGANESPFGPSPKALAAMGGELQRLGWYGDPESLDLRDALARKHALRSRANRRRVGHRRRHGPGGARVRPARRSRRHDARHLSDVELPRDRVWREALDRRLRTRRHARSRCPARRCATRASVAALPRKSRQPEWTLHRTRRRRRILSRASARHAASARRSLRRFRRSRRTAAAAFRRAPDSHAHVFEGVRHGRSAHRLRADGGIERATFSKRSGCTTASIATLRSERSRRSPTTSFATASWPKPLARAPTTTRSRPNSAATPSNRLRTSSASTC